MRGVLEMSQMQKESERARERKRSAALQATREMKNF